MYQPQRKSGRAAFLNFILLLCFAALIVSIMAAPPVANAESIDALIQDWKKKYSGTDIWEVKKADSPEDVQRLKKEGKPYRVVPQNSHIEQTKALRNAVNKILSHYDLTVSMLYAYYPSFSFWADKNDCPFWRIRFNVKQNQGHKFLKPFAVDVNATDGSIRYIRHCGR